MEERVVIEGVGSGLEQWASEKSLGELTKVIGKYADLNSKELSALTDAITKTGESGDDKADDLSNAFSKFTTKSEKASAKLERSISNFDKGSSTTAKVNSTTSTSSSEELFSKSTISVEEFTRVMKTSSKETKTFSSLLVATSANLAKSIVKPVLNLKDAYVESYKSGVIANSNTKSASQSMGEFGVAVYNAGVAVDDMNDITKKYSTAINSVGIKAFGEAAKSFKTGALEFGLSSKESADYLASYIEQQRTMGLLGDINSAKEQKRMKDSLAVTATFSKALGKSVEHLQAEAAEKAKDAKMQAALRGLAPDMANAFQTHMANMPGDVSAALNDFLTFGDTAVSQEAVQKLMTNGMTGTANAIQEIAAKAKAGQLTPEQVQKEMGKVYQVMSDEAKKNAPMLEAKAHFDEGSRELLGMASIAGATAKQLSQDFSSTSNAIAGSEEALKTLAQTTANVSTKIMAEGMIKNAEALDAAARKTLDVAAGPALDTLDKMSDKISDGVIPIFDKLVSAVSKTASVFADSFDPNVPVTDMFGDIGDILTNEVVIAAAAIKGKMMKIPAIVGKSVGSVTTLVSNTIGSNSIFAKFFEKIPGIISKPLSYVTKLGGFLTKIPGLGTLVAAIGGLFTGLADIFTIDSTTLGDKVMLIVGGVLEGLASALFGLPAMIIGSIGSIFLGPEWSAALDDAVDTIKNFINPINWFGSDSTKEAKAAKLEEKRRQRRQSLSEKNTGISAPKTPTPTNVGNADSKPTAVAAQSTGQQEATNSEINTVQTPPAPDAYTQAMADLQMSQNDTLTKILRALERNPHGQI